MPFDQKLIVAIPISTGGATNQLFPGYRFGQRLPVGYIYYLDSALICPSTTVAAQTTDANLWYLRDEDGNTIGSLATGAALATGGTAFASLSATYREQNAASAARSVYVISTQSGNGVAPPHNFNVILNWSVRRPGAAA